MAQGDFFSSPTGWHHLTERTCWYHSRADECTDVGFEAGKLLLTDVRVISSCFFLEKKVALWTQTRTKL